MGTKRLVTEIAANYLFHKSNIPHFLCLTAWQTHAECWENKRKACNSRALGGWLLNCTTTAEEISVIWWAESNVISIMINLPIGISNLIFLTLVQTNRGMTNISFIKINTILNISFHFKLFQSCTSYQSVDVEPFEWVLIGKWQLKLQFHYLKKCDI